jgi:TRAP-type C4-dicarboxylate transport system permease small subunit
MSGGAVLDLFNRFVDGLVAIVRLVCIVLATALFVIVIAAIVARYGFGQAVSWTEEVPRYLLIWVSFLAAAVCVLKCEHVGFELLFDALPPRPKRALAIFIGLLILATASFSSRTSAATSWRRSPTRITGTTRRCRSPAS